MAFFAIDGDVGCSFSLLTFFLGKKESKSPSEGENKVSRQLKKLVEDPYTAGYALLRARQKPKYIR